MSICFSCATPLNLLFCHCPFSAKRDRCRRRRTGLGAEKLTCTHALFPYTTLFRSNGWRQTKRFGGGASNGMVPEPPVGVPVNAVILYDFNFHWQPELFDADPF